MQPQLKLLRQLRLQPLNLQPLSKHPLQQLSKVLHLLASRHQHHWLTMSLKNLKELQLVW
jgi:hypothetical protein